MKYFLDTEFHEYKKDGINTIELISIGIVCETGKEFYMESGDFDIANAEANTWLKENVLANLKKDIDQRCSNDLIASKIREFIGTDKPEFYGYYCDYDWVVFCWLFGRMIDLPKGFPMFCIDLKQMLDGWADNLIFSKRLKFDVLGTTDKLLTLKEKIEKIKSHPDYPKQDNEHNALSDAKWNFALYKFIN